MTLTRVTVTSVINFEQLQNQSNWYRTKEINYKFTKREQLCNSNKWLQYSRSLLAFFFFNENTDHFLVVWICPTVRALNRSSFYQYLLLEIAVIKLYVLIDIFGPYNLIFKVNWTTKIVFLDILYLISVMEIKMCYTNFCHDRYSSPS